MSGKLAVARVVAVDEHQGGRAPSLLLTLDLGPGGVHQAVLSTRDYAAEELLGTQLLCRREGGEVVVVGAHSHGRGLVLLRPDHEVEDGTLVE
jgi:hypothetical protein